MIFIDDHGWYTVRETSDGHWVWTRTSGERSHSFATKKSALQDLMMSQEQNTPVWEAVRAEFENAVLEERTKKRESLSVVVMSLAVSVLMIVLGILFAAGGNVGLGAFFRIIGNIGMGASVIWIVMKSGLSK